MRIGSRHRFAFTLVEMLVTAGVILITASLLLVCVSAAKKRARDTECVNNLKQVGVAMLMYVSTEGAYPDSSPFVSGAWLRLGGAIPDKIMNCPNIPGGFYRPNYFGSGGPEHVPHLGLGINRFTMLPVRESDVKSPSEMIAVIDYYFPLFPPIVRAGGPNVPIPHRNGLQFLVTDGHVEQCSSNKFAEAKFRHRWNSDNLPHDETWAGN